MEKYWFKKLIPLIFIFFLVVAQTSVYAIDVEIEDPTPDLIAPNLISIVASSQELTPSASVKISAEVTDDLSGVRSVYLYLEKPSGYTKGFSLYYNSATNKFETTVSVGNIDEPGLWKVNSVHLYDNKENSRVIDRSIFDFSKVDLNVSDVTLPEKEAPVLHDISVESRDVSFEQIVKVSANVTDNESGVETVIVYYKKPSGKEVPISLHLNNDTGRFEGSIKITQYEELGKWSISYVYLRDHAQNSTRIFSYKNSNDEEVNFDSCSLQISGTTPDLQAPVLDALSIELKQISSASASVILTAKVSDELSGVSNIYGSYYKPSGKSVYLSFYKSGESYIANIPIDRYDELGKWELKYITVRDQMDNSITYYDRDDEKFFNGFDINVNGKITISPGFPFSIELKTTKKSMQSGDSFQLQPILHYTDKTEKDITSDPLTVYSSSNPSLVTVSNSGLITIPAGAVSGNAVVEVSYGDIIKNMVIEVNGGSKIPYLKISPLNLKLSAGQQTQIEVNEINNGVSKDVKNADSGIVYTSLNPSLVSVSPNGIVKISEGVEKGTATIQIKYGDLQGEVKVTITKPVVKSIVLSPLEENLSLTNNKLQLVVKGFMSDGTTKDITASAMGTKYISSNSALAQVSSEGMVTIPEKAKSGVVTISVTNNGITVKSVIKVTGNPELVNLELDSFPNEMNIGEEKQVLIRTTWSDGTEKIIQPIDVKFTSSRPDRVTITPQGVIKALSSGTSNIDIYYEGKIIYKSIKVLSPPSIVSFYLDTAVPSKMKIGEERIISGLKVKWSNGDISDIDNKKASFSSSRPDRVSISQDGKITALSSGTSNVEINYEGKVIQFSVSVLSASTLTSIYLETNVPGTMKIGDTQTIGNVKGKWSDGEETILSGSGLTFVSSRPDRVSVTPDGELTAKSSGTCYIDILYGGKTIRITINVESAPTILGIYLLSNPQLTMKIGDVQTIGTVKAKWSDGNETVLNPADLTFVSSRKDRVFVSSDGKISAISLGTSNIDILYSGKYISFSIKVTTN